MINWFPGHMNKTLKQMREDSKLCDCFIYVLDARCPKSSLNPEFLRVVKDKPIVFVLNKSDLVDETKLSELKKEFTYDKNICVTINSTVSNSSKIVVAGIHKIFNDRLSKNRINNVNFIIRAMVIGVPNSGKSTLVNNLCRKARAITGDKAGVTKSKQWVKVDDLIWVLDTPGVLLPNFENEENAYNLAIVGSVRDDVLNLVDIATKLINKLNIIDTAILKSKYNIDFTDQKEIQILELIGKKRGCILRGGEIDLDRTAKMLLVDFRSGKLGKISLE